jgi:hypothetical protein
LAGAIPCFHASGPPPKFAQAAKTFRIALQRAQRRINKFEQFEIVYNFKLATI